MAFYVLGLILGILLISQFWTLANDIYDARQAKRLFGFIGGGASLGGATGAALTSMFVKRVGTANMVLLSAFVMLLCVGLVVMIMRRERGAGATAAVVEEEGVGGGEAIRMLRESKHLQIIAIVIGCAAMGAAIVEQQLNMAAEAQLGAGQTDSITAFLAQVTVYLSLIGLAIQVGLTSRIHRLLGLGFALMILPVSLGTTGVVMLFNRSLWAPALARILDTSLRYTVDKTSREILFLPLPTSIKYKAKPFVDVTMDRFAKAMGALLILVLIKPWGLNLDWQRLSLASLTLMVIWVFMALRARREYLAAFRRSIEQHDVTPADIRMTQADLQTIETLVEELAHPDERRVLYAIDLLESLEKRNLITPLLLHHTSPTVRARTLRSLQALRPELAQKWVPAIERLLTDEDEAVRAGAVRAISAIRGQEATGLMRPYLDDDNPRIAATAAVALAASASGGDVDAAYAVLQRLSKDSRDSAGGARREVARALAHIPDPRFGDLLVPLMCDASLDVARSAIRSAGRLWVEQLSLHPCSRVTAPEPAPEGGRAHRAGRLRRADRRVARVLPPRSGRRHLGPTPSPGHAGAAAVRRDRQRPRRRAGRSRWLHSIQGGGGARKHPAGPARAGHPARADRSDGARRNAALRERIDAAREPRHLRRRAARQPARSGARREAVAVAQPHLPAARPDLSP